MSTTVAAKQLICDFLMGPIVKTVTLLPDPDHSTLPNSGECEAWCLPSPSRIPVLSLECFLFPRCSRHRRPPMFSKHSFLLMKRKRTARRTMKTPTADKKPMASGGTDKRTQRKNIITIKVAQIRVLTRDIIYSDSICLLMRVANTLQVLTLAGIPRTIHRGKEKDYH